MTQTLRAPVAPPRALSRPRQFDLVLFGSAYDQWSQGLAADSSWLPPNVSRVEHRDDQWRPTPEDMATSRRLIVPAVGNNMMVMGSGHWALVPGRRVFVTFTDKQRFSRFVAANGLAHYAPSTYSPDAPQFPLILKRTNLSGSRGIVLVRSAEELAQRLREDSWRDKPVVLQEYIAEPLDYVTHAIAAAGRIKWHRSYVYHTPPGRQLRPRVAQAEDAGDRVSEHDIGVLEAFLAVASFTGPVSFDYRRRSDGRIAVLEINPRFGASLFRPVNRAHLREAIGTLAANARWYP